MNNNLDQNNNNQENKKKVMEVTKGFYNKNKNILIRVLFGILLLILILSIIRVPYVGQFIDSVFFSFLFGYAKYWLYLYLLFFCILKIFNIKRKPLYSKRLFFACLASTILLSMLLGAINLLIFNNTDFGVKYYCTNVWYDKMFNFNNYFYFGSSNYVDGGLIGSIINNIPGVFIVILCILLIIALYFIVFTNQRKKIINKALKYWTKKYEFDESEIINEIKQEKNKNNHVEEGLISKVKQDAFSLSDNYVKNKVNIDHIKSELEKFLDKINVNYHEIQQKENRNNYLLSFSMEEDDEQLSEIKQFLFKLLRNLEYSIYLTDGILYIKIQMISDTINSILKKYLNIKIKNQNQYALCLDDDYNPVYSELNNKAIIGLMASNQYYVNYLNALISHLTINFNRDYLQISYLSPNGLTPEFISSQNMSKSKINNIELVKKFLSLLNKKINDIEQLYKKYNVTNLDELNKQHSEIIKHHFVIIDYFDEIIKLDNSLLATMNDIFKKAYRYGLIFIIVDHSIKMNSKSVVNFDLIMRFNTNDLSKHDVLYDLNNKIKKNIMIPLMREKELIIIQNKLISILNNLDE